MNWELNAFSSIFNPTNTELKGDKIILPHYILQAIETQELTKFHFLIEGNLGIKLFGTAIDYYESTSESEKNNIYMPDWMFENLYLEPNSRISIQFIENKIKPGEKIIIQPHDSAFLTIENHKELLEHELSQFNTIKKNTSISINFNDNKYAISIIDVFPESEFISLINTDIEVEFIPPLDYVETKPDDWPTTTDWPLPFGTYIKEEVCISPKHFILSNGEKVFAQKPPPIIRPLPPSAPMPVPATAPHNTKLDTTTKETADKFIPFSGKGHRLGN